MARHPNAPDPDVMLKDILGPQPSPTAPQIPGPDLWKTLSPGCQQRAANLTRGDLMLVGNWVPLKVALDTGGNQIRDPNALTQNEVLRIPDYYGRDATLNNLTYADVREIATILGKYNDRHYTSVHFCCCCA